MTSKGIRSLTDRVILLPVLGRFPDDRPALRRLFQESSSFQALCEDYRDCLAAFRHWQQATSKEAPELSRSYAELLQELELEIRQYLEDDRPVDFGWKGQGEK
jgi:hypothetical protein